MVARTNAARDMPPRPAPHRDSLVQVRRIHPAGRRVHLRLAARAAGDRFCERLTRAMLIGADIAVLCVPVAAIVLLVLCCVRGLP